MGLFMKHKIQQGLESICDGPNGLALLEDGKILLEFNQILGVVQDIKRLSGRRFFDGSWTATLSLENIAVLEKMDFALHGDIRAWRDTIMKPVTFDPEFSFDGLNHPLDTYQLESIQTIDAWGGRALLADEPGLGKTIEALGWSVYRDAFPLLVICPSFAKYNWLNEIRYWVTEQLEVQVVSGREPVDLWGDIVIINFDILAHTVEIGDDEYDEMRPDILGVAWDTVIIDEAHYVSNPDVIRTWAIKELCAGNNIPHVIPITATPGKVRPAQMFVPINLVNPNVFPSFFKYGHRYCGPKKGFRGMGWEFKGSSNEKELNDLLTKTVMIRHRKAELFKDLPAKTRIPVLLPGYPDDTYDKEKGFNMWNVEKLKQDAVAAKMPAVLEWVDNMLTQVDKLIIFAHHITTISALVERYGDIAVLVDGSVSAEDKDKAINDFQACGNCGIRKERHQDVECTEYVPNMDARVFIGSSAAKEGATLTAADHVVFLELWWSMADHEQAEDRAYYRMSDPHGLTAWYLLAANSIEEDIANIISFRDQKMKMVMDGKPINKEMVLSRLMRRL